MKKNVVKSTKCLILILMMITSMMCVSFANGTPQESGEIVFVEEGIQDYEVLVNQLSDNIPMVVIDNKRDGIDQITSALESMREIKSIYILSKGAQGEVKIGSSRLNSDSIYDYESQLKVWQEHISNSADILFYGCQSADGIAGKLLFDRIAEMTGADVAASTNYTGTYGMDTDWHLEYQIGLIETDTDLLGDGKNDYKGKLDGTTRTWDGEGDDNDWNNALNWSGDVVPDAYDIAVFDATSTKDVYSGYDIAVYDLLISDAYTGNMRLGSIVTINNDLKMSGGSIDFNRLNIDGNTYITGGEELTGNDMYTYGDVDISGLKNAITTELHVCKGDNPSTTVKGDFTVTALNFEDADYDYQVTGNITLCDESETYYTREFNNSGNLTIKDGGSIDIRNISKFFNSYNMCYNYQFTNSGSITELGTGRLVFDAVGAYFGNSDFEPVIKTYVGDSLFVSLTDLDANLDSNVKETVTVTVKRESDPSDSVSVTLIETQDNSGRFGNSEGLSMVSTETEPVGLQLRYDGTENLILEYVDDNEPSDTITVKLDRDPIIWDGEGETNKWSDVKNWSTNTEPEFYDVVLFDGTSIKDSETERNVNISKVIIEDTYTGTLFFDNMSNLSSYKVKIFNDIILRGGTFNIYSTLLVNGDIDISGGVLSLFSSVWEDSVIKGDLNINGGQVKISGDKLDIKGNIGMSDGDLTVKMDTELGWYEPYLNLYGNTNISGGAVDISKISVMEADKTFKVENVSGKIIDEFIAEEDLKFEGVVALASFILENDKNLIVDGTLICSDSFINNGTVNISNDMTLDLRSIKGYSNKVIEVNESGRVLYDSGGIGFINHEGTPIGTAAVGDEIFIELIDISNNKNINIKESLTAVVTSKETGDFQTVILMETDVNTSVFRNTVGIELVGVDVIPSENQLKYNGFEALEANYVDPDDESDAISCNLVRNSIVWDGGGIDNYWTTAENWSIDSVPNRYDVITLDGTSTKDIQFNSNVEMYQLDIADTYTGEIVGDLGAGFYVSSDMTQTNGNVQILGRFHVGGNLILNGGKTEISYSNETVHNSVDGNITVTGGELVLKHGDFDIAGNLTVTGGAFNSIYDFPNRPYIFLSGNANLQIDMDIYDLSFSGDRIDTSTSTPIKFSQLSINKEGSVEMSGKINAVNYSTSNNSIVTLSGDTSIFTLNSDALLYEGNFDNHGVQNVVEGAIFDATNFGYSNGYSRFYNNGSITTAIEGRFVCDTKDMYFTDAVGNRIVFASIGDRIGVKLLDGNLNSDGSVVEQITVTVESVLTGDTEEIILTETSNNSALFYTSDLTLIGVESEPVAGQLRYDGQEDIEIIYIDKSDSEDRYVCNLHRKPLVWDGGGTDERWSTPENWSEDRLPDEYDHILFNGTSSKSNINYSTRKVMHITIDDTYTGNVKLYSEMTINGNLTVSGGKVSYVQNEITVNEDVIVDGGTISDTAYSQHLIKGDLRISDGSMTMYYQYIDGDLIMTGGSLEVNGYLDFKGDIEITDVDKFLSKNINMYGHSINVTGEAISVGILELNTNGKIAISGNLEMLESGKVNVHENAILNLNGSIVFPVRSYNGFINSGIINLEGTSVLDLRNAKSFTNNGVITRDETTKIFYDALAMGVTDATGAPAFADFNFGDNLIVSMIDYNRNLILDSPETVNVLLKNWTNSDEENYALVETGDNTGEFRGAAFTTEVSDTAVSDNLIYEGTDRDAMQIIYTDVMSGRVEYVVSRNCAEIDVDGIDELLVDGIDYGNGDMNEDPSTYTITLKNKGDIPLGIVGVSLDNEDDFSLSEDLDISDIPADGSRDISILFTPTSCGEKTTNITIQTSDNDEGELIIPISGTGVESPVSSGIEDIMILEGAETYVVDIFSVFSDKQDSDEDLTYEIIYNSNESLVQGYSVDKIAGTLKLNLNKDYIASATIKIRATDLSDAYIEETFEFTVSETTTIRGSVVDINGDAIKGAAVTVTDYFDEDDYYFGTTLADGTFSLTFPRNVIDSWRIITIVKDLYLKDERTSYQTDDENIGTIVLRIETDEEKAIRLAEALTIESLGLHVDDTQYEIKHNLNLAESAGIGSTIEWQSSNVDFISALGRVTRPEVGYGEAFISMTAIVHVNDASYERLFDLYVMEEEDTSIHSTWLYYSEADDEKVYLEWDRVNYATGYEVYISTVSDTYGEALILLDETECWYEVTELINGTDYYFVVKTKGLTEDSGFSNELRARPHGVLPTPTEIVAVAGDSQVEVSFTEKSGVDGYSIVEYTVVSDTGEFETTASGSPITVTGLENGTSYSFYVRAWYDDGILVESSLSNAVTPIKSISEPDDISKPHKDDISNPHKDDKVIVYVNGKAEKAATSINTIVDNQKVTTIVLDQKMILEKLNQESENSVVNIPATIGSDVTVSELNGQIVKDMEAKDSMLEIKTEEATYKLPASAMRIDEISELFGRVDELEEIGVSIRISKASDSISAGVEATAVEADCEIMVEPVEFEITYSNGQNTAETVNFNIYVDRMIALPDDIDASKITTGIVLNSDGTFSHVPTKVTVIDGKYFAEINSLTNSIYSVVFNPVQFKDMENHWAKEVVNDLGSRLILEGIGDGCFGPDREITRAEFTMALVKGLGLMRKGTGVDSFSDVAIDDWYYDAVSIAKDYDLVSGYNGKFEPMKKITREEAMSIMDKAMRITGIQPSVDEKEMEKLSDSYFDFNQSAKWARQSVAACIQSEIIIGKTLDSIAPKDAMTRAEVAAMIRNLLIKSGLI